MKLKLHNYDQRKNYSKFIATKQKELIRLSKMERLSPLLNLPFTKHYYTNKYLTKWQSLKYPFCSNLHFKHPLIKQARYGDKLIQTTLYRTFFITSKTCLVIF